MAKQKLSITVDERIVNVLDNLCEERGENRSQVIEWVLRAGLAEVSCPRHHPPSRSSSNPPPTDL